MIKNLEIANKDDKINSSENRARREGNWEGPMINVHCGAIIIRINLLEDMYTFRDTVNTRGSNFLLPPDETSCTRCTVIYLKCDPVIDP